MHALMHQQLVKIATTGVQVNAMQPRPATGPTAQKTLGNRFLAVLLSALSAPAA